MADENVNPQNLFKKIFSQGDPKLRDLVDAMSLGVPGQTAFIGSLEKANLDYDEMVKALEALKNQRIQLDEAQGMLAGISKAQISKATAEIERQVVAFRQAAKVVSAKERGGAYSPGEGPASTHEIIHEQQDAESQDPNTPYEKHRANVIQHIGGIAEQSIASIPMVGPGVGQALITGYKNLTRPVDEEGVAPYRGHRFFSPLAKGVVGTGALIGGVTALPYALQGLESFYGNTIGSDIAYGQAAGLEGNQGAGAFGAGLINKNILQPLNFLSGLGGGLGGGLLGGTGQIPFMGSDAAKFGSQRALEAFRSGFNPFDALSIQEAKGIQQEVLGRGYRVDSNQEQGVIRGLNRLQNTTGMDSGQALDYIDLFVKRLGVGVDSIVDDLETFAESAQAAGKSVDEYTKEVSAVAKELINANVPAAQARAAAKGFSSIRGVDSSAFAGIGNVGGDPFLLQQILKDNPNMGSAEMLTAIGNPNAFLQEKGPETTVNALRDMVDRYSAIDPSASRDQIIEMLKATNMLPEGYSGLSAKDISLIYEFGDTASRTSKRDITRDQLDKAYDVRKDMPTYDSGRIGDFSKSKNLQGVDDNLKGLYDKYLESVRSSYKGGDLTNEQMRDIQERIRKQDRPADIEEVVNRYIAKNQDRKDVDKEYANIRVEASDELKRFLKFVDAGPNRNVLDPTTAYEGGERNKDNKWWRHGLIDAPGISGGLLDKLGM